VSQNENQPESGQAQGFKEKGRYVGTQAAGPVFNDWQAGLRRAEGRIGGLRAKRSVRAANANPKISYFMDLGSLSLAMGIVRDLHGD
jgi:hypothetical protein